MNIKKYTARYFLALILLIIGTAALNANAEVIKRSLTIDAIPAPLDKQADIAYDIVRGGVINTKEFTCKGIEGIEYIMVPFKCIKLDGQKAFKCPEQFSFRQIAALDGNYGYKVGEQYLVALSGAVDPECQWRSSIAGGQGRYKLKRERGKNKTNITALNVNNNEHITRKFNKRKDLIHLNNASLLHRLDQHAEHHEPVNLEDLEAAFEDLVE